MITPSDFTSGVDVEFIGEKKQAPPYDVNYPVTCRAVVSFKGPHPLRDASARYRAAFYTCEHRASGLDRYIVYFTHAGGAPMHESDDLPRKATAPDSFEPLIEKVNRFAGGRPRAAHNLIRATLHVNTDNETTARIVDEMTELLDRYAESIRREGVVADAFHTGSVQSGGREYTRTAYRAQHGG